ncbi:MAG: hypothetical protein HY741_00780 [Chloroflexi bacterium]|nr:hypothetical protein [Chloroflexota bacterium]
MKKKTNTRIETDELRPEYDLSKLKGGVRGKYAKQMGSGFTVTIHHAGGKQRIKKFGARQDVVVLDPDLRDYFPDSKAVNRALRALVRIADKQVKKTA